LIDIISNNRKDIKFKQALLPALGELMHFISNQECLLGGKAPEGWSIPSLAFVLMIRTIGEDLVTNHIICKIIENLAATDSVNVQKLLANQTEVVNAIWSCFQHSANNEQLRVAALRALCMLSTQSSTVAVTLIDKVGANALIDCLSSNNSQTQQVILIFLFITLYTIVMGEWFSRMFFLEPPHKKTRK
jgi:serine/threonine-protein kinase ULK4